MARLERLERSLEESRAEVEGLKAKVATLVGTIADIKKRQNRPRYEASPVAVHRWGLGRITSAVAAVTIGLLLGGWLWISLSNPDDAAATQPAATTTAARELPASPIVAAAMIGPAPTAVPVATVSPPAPPAATSEQPPEPVSPGRRQVAAAPATTYVGTLSIDAEPGGDIYIDRQKVGRTPQRIANLRAGSHLVWIERDGYHRYTRVVQVPANRISRLSVALEPIDAR